MTLNRLQNYNWEQGTLANPVNLSGDEMSGLIKLALKSSINSDVRGYIHPITSISSYQEWVLNTKYPNLTLVNATIVDAEYSVLFENNATTAHINEGNRIRLVPLNIGIEALKFRIYSHAITTDNIASEETIRGRVSINENGYVVVGAAQENSSWSDTVVIQALPIYQEWDDGVHIPKELTLSISAVKVTSATIILPSVAKPSTAVSGNITLSQHTKPIITGGLNDGSGVFVVPKIGDTIWGTGSDGLSFSFITPTEGTYTISCDVYLFNTSVIGLTATPVNIIIKYPYIQFTVTTDGVFSDISTANPKVMLKRTVRPDGSAVSLADQELAENKYVLTGVVSGNSLIYTLGSGSVAANGVETFGIELDHIRMYVANYVTTIQPTGVENIVQASYNVSYGQITLVYTDGTEESYDAFIDRSTPISGKTPICIGVVSDDASFLMKGMTPLLQDNGNARFLSTSTNLAEYRTIAIDVRFTRAEAELDFASKRNTIAMKNWANGRNSVTDMTYIYHIMNGDYDITINGHALEAYIPAYGELLLYKLNKNKIKNLFSLAFGVTITNDNFMSSTAAPTKDEYQDGKPAEQCNKTAYWTTADNNYGGSQYHDCFIVPFYDYNFKD